MSNDKTIELLRRFAEAYPDEIDTFRVVEGRYLCADDDGPLEQPCGHCAFCEARAFLAAHDAAPPAPDAVSLYEALQPLLDWMNNNDLSADWQRINPESFNRLCEQVEAIEAYRQKAGTP